ncbi:hypothetical protein GCM10009867_30480 [Pedococcus aerophilus]|uniref:ResB-like domain-containing protein n=1 Tax=Pedococcus aerophilus TaxID=436356 RepID=A0ABN3UUI6_9MICO
MPTASSDTGMRCWGRALLVLLAHAALLLALWWSWHPRDGDGNTSPGAINPLLTGLAAVMFWAVLLQVSSRVPFRAVCAVFVLIPFCTFFVQHAGARWWTTDVMRSSGQVEVVEVDRLFAGASRLQVRSDDGRQTLAYSTIGERRTNEYSFQRISPGERYELVTDPTGLVVPLIQPVGYRDSAARPDTALWGSVAAASVLVLEAVSLSALVRARSQVQAVDDRRRTPRRRGRRRDPASA